MAHGRLASGVFLGGYFTLKIKTGKLKIID